MAVRETDEEEECEVHRSSKDCRRGWWQTSEDFPSGRRYCRKPDAVLVVECGVVNHRFCHAWLIVTTVTIEDWLCRHTSSKNESSQIDSHIITQTWEDDSDEHPAWKNVRSWKNQFHSEHTSRNWASSELLILAGLHNRSATAAAFGQNRANKFVPSTNSPHRQASPPKIRSLASFDPATSSS